MTDLSQSPRLQRWSRQAAGFFLGGTIGLIAAVVAWRLLTGGVTMPALTRTEWDTAFRRWKKADVRDYDVEVVVTGLQAATYSVQVRDGQAVMAARNGHGLPQRRTWTTWTVEGMFETIARDLDSVERHAAGRADSTAPQLQLHGSFHTELGYPQQYLRTEMVRFGANREVTWRVTKMNLQPTPSPSGERGS